MTSMIDIQSLNYKYPRTKPSGTEMVLRGLTLRIGAGEFVDISAPYECITVAY
jgi:hypothetical protein